MSFTLLLAVTAAVAASMGYMAARKHGQEDEPPHGSDGGDRESGEADEKPGRRPPPVVKKAPQGSPFATLPFALGDVVSSAHEERWLAGAIVAREDGRVIGALFLAPEGKENHGIAVFAPPRKDVWWMSPADIASPSEPPATLEIRGVAMSRKGRLPVTLERLGQGVPPLGDEGVWAVYDRGRDVAVVITSQGQTHAWSGVRLEEGEYDRLGGGGD